MKLKATLLSLVVLLVACSQVDERELTAMKGNDQAYRLRYTDISASLHAAEEACSCSAENSDSRAEALNNMAYVCYQQMRYDQSLRLLQKVKGFSRNQLELLCADVLRMKVMQRIGQGKAFFDSRLSAQKRLSRILSEEKNLTDRQKHRLHYAQTEFHIVASTYYYYLGQDSAARSEIQDAALIVNLAADTTQWLYYHYMMGSGGLVEGNPVDVTITEFDHLFRVYTLARANHYTYFEANALQSLSAMIADSIRADLLQQQRQEAYNFLYGEHLHWQADNTLAPRYQFAAALSHHAITLFRQYHDLFQTACAMRTLGEVYFSAGHYEEALKSFRYALHLASDHRRSPYQVTPWLAAIHENLSLTYSALGDKQLADSHRNTYLDLLDSSRQNKELDSRKALLKQEARSEQIKFLLFLLLVVLATVLTIIYYRQLGHLSHSFEKQVCEINSSEDCLKAQQRLQQLLKESKERLEECREEYEVMQQRMQQQKQRHIMQRTKLSVVYAIIPYLDRVIAEVQKLNEKEGDAEKHLSYIRELCSGMMTINDHLTEWIQIKQGRLNLQVTRFPLADVLHVISMQQYAFAQQHLTLQIPETELFAKADKPLTLFMVNTLVDNARKFTPEGGKVSVLLDATDDYVEISVCDTGIGLSPNDVGTLNNSKIYDPDRIGASNVGKGFGFGIMNCKGIIGSYKKLSSLFNVCDFGVESEQGNGSRFWFRLPRVLSMLFLLAFSLVSHAMPQRCYELFDSTYTANLQGRYAEAFLYSDSAIHLMEAPLDTSLLVSLYNEQAIAAQALEDWNAYRRSNAECVRLHRLRSIDGSLATDCQRLEKMTENSRVLYVFIVLLLIVSLALFYMVTLRHRLRHRDSMDDIYQRLASILHSFPENAAVLDSELQSVMNSLEQAKLRQSLQEMRQNFSSGLQKLQETDSDIQDVEERLQRWHFEHDRLYVMNQILDNSLSTIKHETMYFPSRIKQMAETLSNSPLKGENPEQNVSPLRGDLEGSLLDLVTYYRHIYMLLYEQAQRQTDRSPLRLRPIAVGDLFAYASKTHGVMYQSTEARVMGDEMQLQLFLDQMFAVMQANGRLSAEERDSMIYIIYNVEGQQLPARQLSELFSPQTERLEYLVMRQIVREHDAACGHPGLRLVAENTERGFRLSFSLLIARNNQITS